MPSLGLLARSYLLLLVVHVIDEKNAIPRAVVAGELLEGHTDVHPLVRLPTSPPLQRAGFDPDGLERQQHTKHNI